jgi:D-sedoheptulose 7-phosphate isomerase
MSERLKEINARIALSIAVKQAFDDELKANISRACDAIIEAHEAGKRVLVLGNGGSACDAEHFALELVGRFLKEREAADVLALTTNGALLTCLANDYPSQDMIFARQIQAHARPGDVVVAISTSGNSPNVIEALREAKARGARTVGLTGRSGGKMAGLCDVLLNVPSTETPRIQESHVLIIHLICEFVEAAIAE